MDSSDPRTPFFPPPAVAGGAPGAGGPREPQASIVWRYALSVDRRWALVFDAQGRNLGEVHRPALAAGPDGRLLTFEQVVRLMCAAPRMRTLLQEIVASGGADVPASRAQDGCLARARALLAELG
ncbi:hypothetical protein [Variovorax sp.]|jgi:hypothetical protein|uniref:hypothetical protein n=1 Tax=Variovorax TaxID=34072 RepID=UPI00155F3754|nr:hypothetical protein [Variovorax sp.]